MPEPKENQSTKKPTGAPALPDETRKLLDDQGDISEQAPTVPESDEPATPDIEPEFDDDTAENTDETDDIVPEPDNRGHRIRKFFVGFWRHKKWTLPLTILVVIGILLAVPVTRYKLLGTFLTKTYSVEIVDSKSAKPVSGATVRLDGQSAMTDDQGHAELKAKVGKRTLTVSKKYYKTTSSQVFVGVKSPHIPQQLKLVATGRQVSVTVIDKLSGKPVANAEVEVLDTSAKTDAQGKATIVLPTNKPTDSMTITDNGYNQVTGSVQVTAIDVPENTFYLVPFGRAYFLSNLSGTIDVVSANFDGSGRATVAAGTGNEDATTQLFVSPDQKYLALYAKRDDSKSAKLYVVNVSSGQLLQMDTTISSFSPTGWSGDNFIYQATSLTLQQWQPHQTSLKSFNATSGHVATLDQTNAKGSAVDYISQSFGFTKIAGGQVIYGLDWTKYYASVQSTLDKQQDSIVAINADGSGRQDLKDMPLSGTDAYTYLSAVQPTPQALYIQLGTDSATVYYSYQNGNVTQSNAVNQASFTKQYPTYYISPDDQHAFWTESRDGQSAMFVGDANANSPTQVATLDSGFTTAGWVTDKYLLVSKGGSQLYVLPASGLASGQQPMKISDFYTPPNFE